MILNDFTVPKTKYSNEQLDAVLVELCEIILEGKQDNPDFYGSVAAAVIDPAGRLVTGLNYVYGDYRVHAERAAVDKYEAEYGELPKGSIVVTTLSPCSDRMDSRYEESCADLLNSKGVKVAYCGYKDPTQENTQDKFVTIITENTKLKALCKKFADTFLKPHIDENFADGKVKGKSRPGRVKKAGASCSGSVTDLRRKAKNSSGERAKMYHWCANMKSGKKKTNEELSKQILSYIKKIHPKGEFKIDSSITNHPVWELTTVPVSSLHLEKDGSPYGQISYVDYDHVRDITAQDIKNKPIVVDNDGWVIDGNHRAVAARELGIKSIPAYVPDLSAEEDQETYAQHMARVNKERELSEVIYHNNIKPKNQDTSGLVNRGKPVPPGKEQKLLGTKVGRIGAYEVYKWDDKKDSAYSVYDPKTRISQMTISGHNKPHAFEIFGIYAGPQAPIRAADLYAWLVKNQGLTLVSDKYQSPGGQRVWQDLEQRYGRSVNVHAFNMRTNKPINTGADDPESTHGYRGDIAQNVRLVASPK